MLHFHVRDPETGHLSADIDHYNYLLGRVKEAVPEMIIQVGGSIAFSPKTDGAKAEWLDYDTRHMLAELDPKPETVTIAIGTSMFDITQMWTEDDIKGTHLEDPKVIAAYAGMFTDAGPAFYLEHLKRLRNGWHPALLHAGACSPARDRGAADPQRCLHGPAEHEHHDLRRRRVRLQPVRLDELAPTPTAGRHRPLLVHDADLRGRPADGDRPRPARARRDRGQPLEQPARAHVDRRADRGGGGALRAVRPQDRDRGGSPRDQKIGVWYDSIDETLQNLGMPPNRAGGAKGFTVFETDGKKRADQPAGDSHPFPQLTAAGSEA